MESKVECVVILLGEDDSDINSENCSECSTHLSDGCEILSGVKKLL